MADYPPLDINHFLRFLARGGIHAPNDLEALIRVLKESEAILTPEVEEVFRKVPRANFVPPELVDDAYSDNPLRLAKLGFNISAPHMHAMCLENLGIVAGDVILDIGSGSGFLTACFSILTGPTGVVHGVDLYDHIIEFSENNLKKFGKAKEKKERKEERTSIVLNSGQLPHFFVSFFLFGPEYNWDNLKFIKRNCFLPSAEGTKYNKIHVGCCCPESKINFLYDLLLPGGVLVTPYGDELLRASKLLDGTIKNKTLAAVRYSDLLLPSDAEIREAEKAIEIAKANTILVPERPISGHFSNLVNSKFLSDFSFNIDGTPIFSHKILLAVRSPYFRKLFQEPISEKIISNCSKEGFISLLGFLYTNENIEEKYFDEILPLAADFEIKDLVFEINESKEKKKLFSCKTDISSLLTEFVGSSFCSDVHFLVEGEKIPSHKVVLNQIDYFRNMFSSGLRESFGREIKIVDCSIPVFKTVLVYLYSETCEVTEENCEALLEQANFFQLPRLTALCENFWYKNINISNAANILQITDHYNAYQLKHFTIEFIFKNVKEVIQTQGWKNLDIDLVSEVLVAAVERGK